MDTAQNDTARVARGSRAGLASTVAAGVALTTIACSFVEPILRSAVSGALGWIAVISTIASIVLGLLGRHRSQPGSHERSLATLGLVIGILIVVVVALLIGLLYLFLTSICDAHGCM